LDVEVKKSVNQSPSGGGAAVWGLAGLIPRG